MNEPASAPGHGNARALLSSTYAPLIDFARDLDEGIGWTATALPGWTVRDLLFHLASDAQRALVALAAPSALATDTDEVSYWRSWQPGTAASQAGLRGVRIQASAWSSVRGPADLFCDTATAVLALAERTDLAASVTTQGHVMTVGSLLRTLAVEATVHHLDLGDLGDLASLAAASPDGLKEVRRVLDQMLGQPAPAHWADDHYIRVATGRRELDPQDGAALGDRAQRIPLFG